MRSIKVGTLILATTAALLYGCGNSRPPLAVKAPLVRAEISVTVTRPQVNAGDPVELLVRLTNTGSERIEISGCGDEPARLARLLDPNSEVVHDSPFLNVPSCPAFWSLNPGETKEWTRKFSGQLYTQEGDVYPAPSGTYTLVSITRFTASGDEYHAYTATGSGTFAWKQP